MRRRRDGDLLAGLDDRSPEAVLRREVEIDHLLVLAEADVEAIEADLATATRALSRAKTLRDRFARLKALVDADRAASRTKTTTVKMTNGGAT